MRNNNITPQPKTIVEKTQSLEERIAALDTTDKLDESEEEQIETKSEAKDLMAVYDEVDIDEEL